MADPDVSLLDRAARRRLTERQEAINAELRRLLDAGLELMRRDLQTVPRVAAVVAAAGSSNDAFYRAFGSRDAFLAAIVDDVLRGLIEQASGRRESAGTPAERIEVVLDTVLDQAVDADVATTTRAVLSCAPGLGSTEGIGIASLAGRVAALIHADLAELGSPDPDRDALTLARTAIGEMESQLWAGAQPGTPERDYLHQLVGRLAAVRRRPTPGH